MRLAPLLALGALAATAAPAHAGPFELHAELRVGGSAGYGVGGDQKDKDFFDQTRGGVYGVLVGARLLFVDLTIEHDQFTDFSSVRGTWTQFSVGTAFGIALDEPVKPAESKIFLTLGGRFGFGLGTGQQIMPPLDNGQISDKGFLFELSVGLEYKLNSVIALGAALPFGWGYMFKNDAVNELSNHYQTFHAMGLGYLKLRLEL